MLIVGQMTTFLNNYHLDAGISRVRIRANKIK